MVVSGVSFSRESLRALRDAKVALQLLEILGPDGDAREWRAELRSCRRHIPLLLDSAVQGSMAGKIKRQFWEGKEF